LHDVPARLRAGILAGDQPVVDDALHEGVVAGELDQLAPSRNR
jgi:hypothetical protein